MSENLNEIWKTCLNLIKQNNDVPEQFFQSFFEESKLDKIDNNTAFILTPDMIAKNTLSSDKNISIIENYLHEITQTNFKIRVVTKDELISNSVDNIKDNIESFDSNLIKNFTFENFVVGDSNKESYHASLAVSSDPGNLFNPLFIYGKSGLGKTHLAHSIGNEIKKEKPNMRILYVTSETFLNDYLDVVRNNKDNTWFNKKYRDIDVLILDDIQFLGNKQKSNEMFFNVYNDLFNKNKQIIITSDVMPKELDGLEERLVSRFTQGLSVSIIPPELSTSILILKNKIKNSTDDFLNIDEQSIEYLAKNFSKDVRDLEGALRRLIFYSINIANEDEITIDVVKQAFSDYKVDKVNGEISAEKILKCVCSYYNITKSQMISKSRQKKLALARHISVYLTRTILDTPYEKIGLLYNRDHSTIISSYHKIKEKVDENEQEYILVINELTNLLKT